MFGKDFTQLNLRRFSLAFQDRILEKRFQYNKMMSSMWFARICYYVATLVWIAVSIISVLRDKNGSYALARFIVSIALIAFCIFINTKWYQRWFFKINIAFMFLVIVLKLVSDYIRDSDGSITTALIILIMSTFLILDIRYTILLNLMLIIPFYIRQYTKYHDLGNEEITFYVLFSNYILLTSLSVVCIYLGLQQEKQARNEFIASINIDNQNSTYDNILSILVPDFVKTLLNRGKKFI